MSLSRRHTPYFRNWRGSGLTQSRWAKKVLILNRWKSLLQKSTILVVIIRHVYRLFALIERKSKSTTLNQVCFSNHSHFDQILESNSANQWRRQNIQVSPFLDSIIKILTVDSIDIFSIRMSDICQKFFLNYLAADGGKVEKYNIVGESWNRHGKAFQENQHQDRIFNSDHRPSTWKQFLVFVLLPFYIPVAPFSLRTES